MSFPCNALLLFIYALVHLDFLSMAHLMNLRDFCTKTLAFQNIHIESNIKINLNDKSGLNHFKEMHLNTFKLGFYSHMNQPTMNTKGTFYC